MFSKIVVPLDGSTSAEAALEAARHLAGLEKGEIVLVRVRMLPTDTGYPLDMDYFQQAMEEENHRCESYLLEIRERLQREGLRASFQVLNSGDAAMRIIVAAQQFEANLILMTSQGRSASSHMLLGSVAEKTARLAHCPVMIVGRNSEMLERAQQLAAARRSS